jgi:hypothetical protein
MGRCEIQGWWTVKAIRIALMQSADPAQSLFHLNSNGTFFTVKLRQFQAHLSLVSMSTNRKLTPSFLMF